MANDINELKLLLSYYYDAQATKELPRDQSGNYTIDFGAEIMDNSPPIAGRDTISTAVYVKNTHQYPMELKPVTLDKDLSIIEYPQFLDPGEIALVRFAFTPSIDRIKPLEGGTWDFTKIVYSKV
jgi:hypothetical protein